MRRQYVVEVRRPPDGEFVESVPVVTYTVVAHTLRGAIKVAHRIHESDYGERGEAILAKEAAA